MSGAGSMVGLLAGCGILLVIAGIRAVRWRRLDRTRALLPAAPTAARSGVSELLLGLFGPIGEDVLSAGSHLLGGYEETRLRLIRSGAEGSVARYRYEQLACAAAGLMAGLVLAMSLLLRDGQASTLGLAVMVVGLPITALLLRDRMLTRAVAARQRLIGMQFPSVAELLALAVAAGETPAEALIRVAGTTDGHLGYELKVAAADMRQGALMLPALRGIQTRTGAEGLDRFVDGVALAVERGTPLAEVLRAQARATREAGHRRLMELAGRKDSLMLVPIVFLVLPTVVMVAVFPGLADLGIQIGS